MLHNGSMSARSRHESSLATPSSARRPTSRNNSFSARSSSAVPSVHATPTRDRGTASTQSSARRMRGNASSAADNLPPPQTQSNAMKVYVRVRPFSEREMSQKGPTHSTIRIDAQNPTQLTILEPARGFRPLTTHPFTRCFWSVFQHGESDLLSKVDTYLIGGMNSARRSRAQSMVTQSAQNSVRRGTRGNSDPDAAAAAAASAQSYEGAGSAPVMVDANVSHPPYAGQDEVYIHVGKPIVDNTLDGYNGCVFAYGQTGSGKTFTMLGYAPSRSDIRARRESFANAASAKEVSLAESSVMDVEPFESDDGDDVVDKTGLDPNELQGIIPRSCTDLFDGLRAKREKDSDFTYRVEVSYYEIYNEKVFDLIRPQSGSDLKVRHGPAGPFIEDLASKAVNKEEDVARVIRRGMQERHTAATKFNDRSSRSHAILSFNIVQLSMDESDNAFQMRSKLNLVDLAGSERTGAAGAEGEEFHDGVKINQSLTVLGRVIDRLADLSQNKGGGLPVPYRDSNLTWVLSDSIGGNSQTSMVATISPHTINYDEMRQTIRYASRAKNIINWVKKNEDPQVVMIRELRERVANLELRLKEAGGSNYTNEYVRGLEKKVKELERKCADQERIVASLRAQLEFAGIADPTTSDGYLDPENKVKVDQQRAKAEEAMKKQLEKAQMTIAELKTELERRANTIEPERLKAMKEKLENQDKRLQALSTEVTLYKRLWRHINDIDAVMALVEDKENLLLRACENALSSTSTESSAIVERMNKEREDDLAELKRRHDEELAAQAERFRARLKDALDDSAAQQQQLLDRHKDAVAQLEDRLQRTRDLNDQERKRTEEEKELFRQKLTEAQERMRLDYQQEMEKLRARVEGEAGDRQKSGDVVRQMQDAHDRDAARMKEDLERLRRSKDADLARLQNQLENERLRRESDLMEKDRQLRLVRNEIEDGKRVADKLADEKNKMEKEYQDQIRDLMVQQEQLIAVSNAVLADWENKSSSLEADLHKLRGLVYDKDYMNFRQKIREMAFMERENFDQKFQELDEKEKLQAARIGQIISKARRAYDEQSRSLRRFEKDVKERIGGRVRGLDGSESGSAQGSPPPEMISTSLSDVA